MAGFLEGFNKFAQSPEARGLAQGLLAGSQPNMNQPVTFGSALAQGLQQAHSYADLDRQRKLQEQQLQQQVNKDEFKKIRDQEKLAIDKDTLASRQALHRAQIERLRQEEARKQQQQDFLVKSIQSGGQVSIDSQESPQEIERKKRAGILLAGGDVDGALKVLSEKPEKQPENEATKAFLTQNQGVLQAIDTVLPKIDSLIKEDVPFQAPIGSKLFSPAKQARYEATVSGITDTLVGALNLPKTNESLHLVGQMVRKQTNEGDKAYRKRLKELQEDLQKRKQSSLAITSVGAAPLSESKEENNDPLGLR